MSSRNINNARGKSRRLEERRKADRRLIKDAFGSEKWLRAIQAEYLLWPREDRRQDERRMSSRRVLERRAQLHKYRRRVLRHGSTKHAGDKHILTTEEKNMLRDLYNRF